MSDKGVTEAMWKEMAAYAKEKGLKGGNYKKLNLPFENKLLGLPIDIRERMAQGVEDFVHELLSNVFNARDTAPLAVEAILQAGSFALGPKASRIEDPEKWTEARIRSHAKTLNPRKGSSGNFDD
jgi:hypothetical protein